MKQPTTTIYTDPTIKKQALMKIYNGTKWINTYGWIYYNGAWWYIDEPNTIYNYLLDNNNNYILDSSGHYILVKGV